MKLSLVSVGGAALTVCSLAMTAWLSVQAADAQPSAFNAWAAAPPSPNSVLMVDACVKCHAADVEVWKQTPHSKTFEELHRRPEAKEISRKLGVRSIKYDDRCIGCHYTQKIEDGRNLAVAGISCESCHGAAKGWLDIHHDYGGPNVTRQTETPEHRRQRFAASIAAGMRNPVNAYLVAQSCYRCHSVQDEELVNVGGHSVGSLDFELVSWSQGTIHHKFLDSDGKVNAKSSPERLRVLFVAGMIADLEASLRATSKATVVAEYGVNAAKRAARGAARLKSVAKKVNDPSVNAVIAVYESVRLAVGNEAQLQAAADQIGEHGVRFAAEVDPQTLAPLDSFLPPPDRWK